MNNSIRVETVLTGKNRETLIQDAQASPLAVAEAIRGNAEGEAEYGTELEWKHEHASVRVSVTARVRCGSDTQRMFAAVDHCKSIVQATLSAEVDTVAGLLKAVGGQNAGTSGD